MTVKTFLQKQKALIIKSFSIIVFGCVVVGTVFYFGDFSTEKKYWKQKSEIKARAVGSNLMKADGDTTSVLPPIEWMDDNGLRITFGSSLQINPDSLANYIIAHFDQTASSHFVVSVLSKQEREVVYGFEINYNDFNTIPCLGRNLPNALYHIEINFHEHPNSLAGYATTAIVFVFCILMLLNLWVLKQEKQATPSQNVVSVYNNLSLDVEFNKISQEGKSTQLTAKEAQVLKVLLNHSGKLVTKDELNYEVWEKNGVVTGRSLDMYISRLRKKLSEISSSQIVNQHGKGYVLVQDKEG